MWSILIEKLHVVAARLCGVFFCCQIREADWSNRAELSQVRVGPTFSKTHERSQIPNKPETLNTKPPSPCAFCRVCVWEIHDKKGFLSLSGVTWWGDQTAHGIERPKTGMFTFDKEQREKQSGSVRSYSRPHIYASTHWHIHKHACWSPRFTYGDLNLALLRASGEAGGGGRIPRQKGWEKQGCLQSHPLKERTPARVLTLKVLWGLHTALCKSFTST